MNGANMGLAPEAMPAMLARNGVPARLCSNCRRPSMSFINGKCRDCRPPVTARAATPSASFAPVATSVPRAVVATAAADEAKRAKEKADLDFYADEIRAWSEAIKLGKQHQGDPRRLVNALGVPVQYADLSARNVLGEYNAFFDTIVIHNKQSPAELERSIAHECGHRILGHRTNSVRNERAANCFMEQFLKLKPETPAEAWARIQANAHKDAVAAAQRNARARYGN